MKRCSIRFLFLVILLLRVFQIYAEDKLRIPNKFFSGKWRGNIQYEVKTFDDKGRITSHHTSSLKNINIVVEEFDDKDAHSVETFKNSGMDTYTAEIISKIRNSFYGNAFYTGLSQFYDNNGRLVETLELKNGMENIEISGHFSINNKLWIYSDTYVEIIASGIEGSESAFSVGAAAFALSITEGINFKIEESKLLINYEGKLKEDSNSYIKIKGELCKIKKCTKKDKIPLNIFLSKDYKDEAKIFSNGTKIQKMHDKLKIVTKDGCVELFIKEYFKINGLDGTKMEISISKVLDGVVESNIYEGYIQVDIWEDGKHHQFTTKDAIVEVNGTNFTMEVSGDGATILTVLDGKAEFSDKKKRKTVLVKKNQKSVIKPNGLPSESVSIDPNQILRWWE